MSMIISCGGKMDENKSVFPSIKDVPETSWKKLAEKRIYFSHQSVGYNILDGMRDIMKENPQIILNIVETSNPEDFKAPIFAHSRVGNSEDPKSKCDSFAGFMDQGLGNKADIAFFKFCFVDVTAKTNADQLFTNYKKTMSSLKEKYPQTTFIHMTTPLTVVQTGPKAWVKKIIGRPIGGYYDNIKRDQFNEGLIKEYEDKEPIFDLAKIESTFKDGSRAVFKRDGKVYPRLVPAYTDDGGHLNEMGRGVVAEQLLILLAKLSDKKVH
jgi:hypothetical protein